MKSSLKRLRLRLPWLAVPLVLWLAEPTVVSLAVGGVLAILGLTMRAWAAGTLVKNAELSTDGPYAFTRNPLYVGSLLIGLGISVATLNILVIALTVVVFALLYSRTMRDEERLLADLYGDRYREYRRAVPAFFPRLTPYRPDQTRRGFDVSRYLHNREYQSALGVAAMMIALVLDLIWW
jgi:protein-S-isoprenylcysteine O-methyltransferase Ste14